METKNKRPFAERHPRWNTALSLMTLILLFAIAVILVYLIFKYSGIGITRFLKWLKGVSSGFDAVVIVALITGTVSIVSVIISSIVARSIDYKKQRRSYLAQKREKSYAAFVEMVYKIQHNSKESGSYSEKDMISDIYGFSQELTLWGSKNVVNKWVEFRNNASNPNSAMDNMFLLESIMNEMRKDLGVKKVKKGNLLSFFVNDINSVLKKR